MKPLAVVLMGVAGIGLLSIGGYLAYDYYADEKIKKIVEEILNGESPTDVAHFSVVTSNETLARLNTPDVFIRLGPADIRAIEASLLKMLQSDESLKKDGVTVTESSLSLLQQAIGTKVRGAYATEDVDIRLSLAVDFSIRSQSNQLVLDPILRGIEIEDLSVWGVGTDVLRPAVNKVLASVNGAIDSALRASIDPLVENLAIQPPEISDFAELSSDEVTFAPKAFVYNPWLQETAFFVNPNGLYAMADVVNLGEQPEKTELTAAQIQYPKATEAALQQVFATYQTTFTTLFESVSAQKIDTATNLAVSKAYVAETARSIVSGSPLKAHIKFNEKSDFASDIALDGLVDLGCAPKREACTYQDACANNNVCKKTVQRSVQKVVRSICDGINCLVRKPFGGCLVESPIKIPCDKTITELVNEAVDVASPFCDGYRAAAKVSPGMCQLASNISKAECDTFQAVDAVTCEAEQQFQNVLASNPVGEVYGWSAVIGSADAAVSRLDIADDMSILAVPLTANGNAHIDANVSFRLKQVSLSQLVCNPTWTGEPKADVSVSTQDEVFSFGLVKNETTGNGNLELTYQMPDDKKVKINLAQSPLEVIRQTIGDSEIRCDRIGVPLKLVKIAMAVMPRLSLIEALTKNLDFSQKTGKLKFAIKIPAFDIKIGEDKHQFRPVWSEKVVAFNRASAQSQ